MRSTNPRWRHTSTWSSSWSFFPFCQVHFVEAWMFIDNQFIINPWIH
jgi:hypothetical protein